MGPGRMEGGNCACNAVLKGFSLFYFKVCGGTSFSTSKKNPDWISVNVFDSSLER